MTKKNIEVLKNKIKKLRFENRCLEYLLSDAQEDSWDFKESYLEFLNGDPKFEVKPDKRLAEWFAKRWNLDEDGEFKELKKK